MVDLGSLGQGAQEFLSWLPPWAADLGLFALALALAFLAHKILYRIAIRLVGSAELFWRALVIRTEGPTRFGLAILALAVATELAPLSDKGTAIAHRILLLAFVILLGWVALTALDIWVTIYLRRFTTAAAEDPMARKHITQMRILRRIAATLIVIITVSAGLMTFDPVRQYGVSLIASAGVAGVVVALALQPVLKNIFAGIQLAVTQPIRIDDAVIVENEWGNVEDITTTYVVVRLWDWRRLVVPLSYFIEKPFQNWSREGTGLIGTATLYVDYTAPVAELRRKFTEILAASPLWDHKVANLQVTDLRDNAVEIRMLVSASTTSRVFDLRCEVREKMVDYLQAAYPSALPHWRGEITGLARGEVADGRGRAGATMRRDRPDAGVERSRA
ncbi:MAG TPA: mechanosensitive ion channel domain-containing protein [Stellaceae bacterium]|nr:mechanosensitive ion channel domain-containing protein [Stellaceae bacterium]